MEVMWYPAFITVRGSHDSIVFVGVFVSPNPMQCIQNHVNDLTEGERWICGSGQCGSGQFGTMWQGWKMQEWTMRHHVARVDSAGVDNAGVVKCVWKCVTLWWLERNRWFTFLLGLQLTTCKVGFVVDKLKVADCVWYQLTVGGFLLRLNGHRGCLLYTSPSPRD